MLQRAFTLLVLLIGVGLGLLLPRPWAEVPDVEARVLNLLCVGEGVLIYNTGDEAIHWKVTLLGAAGNTVIYSEGNLDPGHTTGRSSSNTITGIVTTDGSARVLGMTGDIDNPVGFSECVRAR